MVSRDLELLAVGLLDQNGNDGVEVAAKKLVEALGRDLVSGIDERVVGLVDEGEGENSLLGEVHAVDASEGAAAENRGGQPSAKARGRYAADDNSRKDDLSAEETGLETGVLASRSLSVVVLLEGVGKH